jgi:gamma-glutamyltranspeptidase/glutathione hydrolase
VDPSVLASLVEEEHLSGHAWAAVPTTLAVNARLLETLGTMTVADTLAPAIEIARGGYRLTTHHVTWLENYLQPIRASDRLRVLVLEDGLRVGSPGDPVCNPDLAATLGRIALEGPDVFYRGDMARQIEADMVAHGGFVRKADLAIVDVREAKPLRGRYRGYDVVSFPSPGAGGQVIETLNLLATYPPSFLKTPSTERLHVMVEAFRIARADHQRLGPPPDAVAVSPERPYLEPSFAEQRATLITPGRAIPTSELTGGSGYRWTGEHTTHLSVIDRWGNAVAITQSLGRQYGAKVASDELGFPYNSLLETFHLEDPSSPGFLRPRARYPTDMAPTIVLADRRPLLVLGSSGSERVPGIVSQVVSNLVDRGLGPRDAITEPRVLWGGQDPPKIYLEIAGSIRERDADRLESFGFRDIYRLSFPPRPIDLTFFGGVNAAGWDPVRGGFVGVGDPRRLGFALGPRVVPQDAPTCPR